MAVIVIRAKSDSDHCKDEGLSGWRWADGLVGVSSTFRCQRYACCVKLLLAGVQTVSQRSFAAWGEARRQQGRGVSGFNKQKTSTEAGPCK